MLSRIAVLTIAPGVTVEVTAWTGSSSDQGSGAVVEAPTIAITASAAATAAFSADSVVASAAPRPAIALRPSR